MDFKKTIELLNSLGVSELLESPELIGELISSIIENYKKPVYSVCEEILEIMQDYANADEYFAVVAKIKRQQFDAYIRAGFDENQAMLFIMKQDDNIAKQMENINLNLKGA